MRTETPQTIYLKDYKPYPCELKEIALDFDIRDGETRVRARQSYRKKAGAPGDLYLNGEDIELRRLTLDGYPLENYSRDDKGLRIPCPEAEEFTLEIETLIHPETNTRLEGLYKSGGSYCTQCEAEGFRRITYFPDRPDVMSVFTVRIEADRKTCPVLLSNGNKTEEGTASDGRHYTIWHDPFPKPCYLFALVAGDLTYIQDTYTTKSKRNIDLYIYVRPGDEDQCSHAMESLKKAMKWDEDVYGLEYDLDLFNIVAVSDFNMGAMENKSLNIFNTALVLAHRDTATDSDFMRVESVIAHEYFHNWSGNRVTCRDWFQLSLKEGLTVFRDQEFSSDLNSRAVARIDDVSHLRRLQFPEDAGPLAHPVRPDNYIEINNFYTMTVYEKGAEVIRMLRTLLGPAQYRKGADLYFSRHDGQAVTCEDFIRCMEEASGMDLRQFRLWYEQAGTPVVRFKGEYDPKARTYTVELSQEIPETPGQKNKKPMHIPVAIGLLNDNGDDIILSPACGEGNTAILHLTEQKQSFILKNIPSKPVPSVLRNFSAPVRLKTDLGDDDLTFLMLHDGDGFNRWEAGQAYFLRVLNRMIDNGEDTPASFMGVYGGLLERALDHGSDKALMARALSIPDIPRIALERDIVDPQAIYRVRETVLDTIASEFSDRLEEIYRQNRSGEEFCISPEAMGRRALQNTAMLIRANRRTDRDAETARQHYESANNMTDRMAALHLACALDGPAHDTILQGFYARFRAYPLVIDKWFAAQAGVVRHDIIRIVNKLKHHSDFNIKNPNRVRALYASFAMNNPASFHAPDGSGYNFLQEAILELNGINPQIAARLLTPLRDWRRYAPELQAHMKVALQNILDHKNLSPDVYEIASKSLS